MTEDESESEGENDSAFEALLEKARTKNPPEIDPLVADADGLEMPDDTTSDDSEE